MVALRLDSVTYLPPHFQTPNPAPAYTHASMTAKVTIIIETKKEVRSFLGLIGYYQRFIPNFAAISAQLTDLTRKNCSNKVLWGLVQERAFYDAQLEIGHCAYTSFTRFEATFYFEV